MNLWEDEDDEVEIINGQDEQYFGTSGGDGMKKKSKFALKTKINAHNNVFSVKETEIQKKVPKNLLPPSFYKKKV